MTELYNVLCSLGIVVKYANTDSKLKLPYITYLDYYHRFRKADNGIVNDVISVQVDYFTKKQLDPDAEKVAMALNRARIPFERKLIIDEGIYHHIYDCEVISNGIL